MMVRICAVCNKEKKSSDGLSSHQCHKMKDMIPETKELSDPVISSTEPISYMAVVDQSTSCEKIKNVPESSVSDIDLIDYDKNVKYDDHNQFDRLSGDDVSSHSLQNSNGLPIKQEQVFIKSEVDNDNGSDSNWDVGESLDFEMPECDVEIKLEDEKSPLNFLCDSVSQLDGGASSYVICENNVNFLKDDVLNYSYNKLFPYNIEGEHLSDDISNKFYHCGHCGRTFIEFQSLQNHILEIHKEKVFPCNLCDEKFIFRHELNSHSRQRHLRENHFRCSVCNKRFLSPEHVKSHMAVHAEEKYVCCVCKESFENADIAKKHLSNHLNEEKFKCMVCDKEFTGNVALKKHITKHTDDDMMKFVNSKKTNEKKSVNGLAQFRCEICDKSFMNLGHLMKHAGVHTMIRPFPCSLCTERFANFSYLRTHVAKRHPGFELCPNV